MTTGPGVNIDDEAVNATHTGVQSVPCNNVRAGEREGKRDRQRIRERKKERETIRERKKETEREREISRNE